MGSGPAGSLLPSSSPAELSPLGVRLVDFGISDACLTNGLTAADVEDGVKPGVSAAEKAELRTATKLIRLLEQENEVLRQAAAYLLQANLPEEMMSPLAGELAGDGVPVTVTCRVLNIARQPYYRWLTNPVTDAELIEAHVAKAVFDAHRDDPEFGYRFLADEVRAAGHEVGDRTVWRICRDNRWWSGFAKRRSHKSTKPGRPAHNDLVPELHRGRRPSTVWLADIAEHRTGEGSSTAARSRTCSRTGSSAGPSTAV